jgi:hypothetical protein
MKGPQTTGPELGNRMNSSWLKKYGTRSRRGYGPRVTVVYGPITSGPPPTSSSRGATSGRRRCQWRVEVASGTLRWFTCTLGRPFEAAW